MKISEWLKQERDSWSNVCPNKKVTECFNCFDEKTANSVTFQIYSFALIFWDNETNTATVYFTYSKDEKSIGRSVEFIKLGEMAFLFDDNHLRVYGDKKMLKVTGLSHDDVELFIKMCITKYTAYEFGRNYVVGHRHAKQGEYRVDPYIFYQDGALTEEGYQRVGQYFHSKPTTDNQQIIDDNFYTRTLDTYNKVTTECQMLGIGDGNHPKVYALPEHTGQFIS